MTDKKDIEKNMDAAAQAAADATEQAAENVSEAATAQAAKDVADAAIAATAAAGAAAALAETHAAQTINENKENLEWLHQHATNTDTSLKDLATSQSQIVPQVQAMLEAQQAKTLEAVGALLTPRQSTQESPETPPKVKPEEQSEDEDARREKELKNKKRTRRFI